MASFANIPAIGIDLGTTNTCVAVIKNDKVEVIANQQGKRTTPSVVCFTDDGIKIGQTAKDVSSKYPENTIFEIKRIIGRKFDDVDTQRDLKNWPFKVENHLGNPYICVNEKGKLQKYYPEQISSFVLGQVKKDAEEYFGEKIIRAVITVPAYFNNAQRLATKDAAEIAGLKVLKIINEPTAAALAYGYENKSYTKRTVLVYDLGGGTFDVSIVKIDDEKYTVVATSGDTHLGGSDFDTNLVNYLVNEFKTKKNKDISQDKAAIRRLRSRCEAAKEKLSSNLNTNIELLSFIDGEDFDATISRIQFENLNADLFYKTLNVVKTCLTDAKLKKEDIDDIVLVGGSTRIPKIQEILKQFFNGKDLMKTINPDEAVACGAAIQAAILDGQKTEIAAQISDVTSLSLGIELVTGLNEIFISRNTPIPCTYSKKLYTSSHFQTSIVFPVYEGERLVAKDNNLLGKFTISNLPPKPAGQVDFDCTFNIDLNGILKVTSVNKNSGLKGDIEIGLKENRISKEEIDKIIKEAEKRKGEDQLKANFLKCQYELESYCRGLMARAKYDGDNLSDSKKAELNSECEKMLNRLKEETDGDQITRLHEELKNKFENLFK